MSPLRPWRETFCADVPYFEGWRLNSKLLRENISSGWQLFGEEIVTLGWFKSRLVEVLHLIYFEGGMSFPNECQSGLMKQTNANQIILDYVVKIPAWLAQCPHLLTIMKGVRAGVEIRWHVLRSLVEALCISELKTQQLIAQLKTKRSYIRNYLQWD